MANTIMNGDVPHQLTQEADNMLCPERVLCRIQHFFLCSTAAVLAKPSDCNREVCIFFL